MIAYPTEGVLGSDIPLNSEAVHRILKIKKEDVSAGKLIVIASDYDQISDWVEISKEGTEKILNEPDIVTWIC